MNARIVSLLPSATEIVCALGAGGQLVGVSHECDFPADVRGLPVLTSARIDARGTSRSIDAAVRAALVADALSIYAIDSAQLGALRPDVVVTQDLCEVCAVSLDDVRAAVARLAGREHITVVSLRPTRFADVLDDVERVAAAIGAPAAGVAVRRTLVERVERITARVQAAETRPRVASIEWLDPVMLGGTWMPELIERAGGTAVGVEHGAPAPTVDLATLAALRPDVVMIKPCGFAIARTMEERALIDATILRALPAPTRVYVTDGNAFFNRPGPRLVESLEILAACTHPALFADFLEVHAGSMLQLR